MHRIFAPAVLAVSLAACSTTSGFDPNTALGTAGIAYAAFCGASPKDSACSPAHQAQVLAAEQAASDAIAAYQAGTLDQASMEKLVQDAVTLLADFRSHKK